jgi:SpoVK/Ycf46/Vps4 family AAA+-type ATPase
MVGLKGQLPRNVNYEVPLYDSSDNLPADFMRFIDQIGEESVFSTKFTYTNHGKFIDVVMLTMAILRQREGIVTDYTVRFEFHSQTSAYVYLYHKDTGRQIVMVSIVDGLDSHDPFEMANRDMAITASGIPNYVIPIMNELSDRVQRTQMCRVTWKFKADGHTDSKTVMLKDVPPALTEFYPWLPCKIEDYYKNYVASKSNILLLLGEPGTGKTSFIRYLAYSQGMSTMITYDEFLLASDSFFVDFLSDDEHNMLVIEDAETILTDRENDGNKVMSKILNVSDGLIKILDKKVIFTANLGDIDKVDRALVRPGRAFDVMMFRALSFEEAKIAARAANLALPTDDRDYTLAELFNKEETDSVVRNVERARKLAVGFTAR